MLDARLSASFGPVAALAVPFDVVVLVEAAASLSPPSLKIAWLGAIPWPANACAGNAPAAEFTNTALGLAPGGGPPSIPRTAFAANAIPCRILSSVDVRLPPSLIPAARSSVSISVEPESRHWLYRLTLAAAAAPVVPPTIPPPMPAKVLPASLPNRSEPVSAPIASAICFVVPAREDAKPAPAAPCIALPTPPPPNPPIKPPHAAWSDCCRPHPKTLPRPDNPASHQGRRDPARP